MANIAATPDLGVPITPDFSNATDPFALFETWFAEANAAEVNDPNAMSLATAGADGLPNVRIVLLKGLDGGLDAPGRPDRGFVFYTNTLSAKGREMAANPQAALLFHWKSLRRQVRIRGAITPVSEEEASAYYASRPRGSRIGAWASRQSEALATRAELEAEIARLEAQYAEGSDIPRPPHWSGYRLTPTEIEFWSERPFRLHDRAVFRRSTPTTAWSRNRLYP